MIGNHKINQKPISATLSILLFFLIIVTNSDTMFSSKYINAAKMSNTNVSSNIIGNTNTEARALLKLFPADINLNFVPPGNSIPLPPGSHPWSIAYDPANNYIYVPIAALGIVSVIDASSNTIVKNIPSIIDSQGIVYDPANNHIYVSSYGLNIIYVIDGATNKVKGNITAGFHPMAMAYDSANNYIYITNPSAASGNIDTVSVIDSSTDKVVDIIPVGSMPWFISYDPANNELYVSNDNSISVIDGTTNKVIKTIPFQQPSEPLGSTYDSSNQKTYVATHSFTDTASIINGTTDTVIGHTDALGTGQSLVWGAIYNPSTNHIDITNSASNSVSIIDGETNKVINTIAVGDSPRGITFDSNNGCAYVVNGGYSTPASVSIVDCDVKKPSGLPPPNICLNSTIQCQSLFIPPWIFAYDPANNHVYITNTGTGTVSTINGTTNDIITNTKIGVEPIGIVYNPSNYGVYIANFGSNSVSVINSTTNDVTGNIIVGPRPMGVIYNPINQTISVSHYGSNTVDIIKNFKVIGYDNNNLSRPIPVTH